MKQIAAIHNKEMHYSRFSEWRQAFSPKDGTVLLVKNKVRAEGCMITSAYNDYF